MAAASPLGSLPAAAAFSRLFFLLLLALPMSGLRSPCLHGEGQSLPTPLSRLPPLADVSEALQLWVREEKKC